MIVGLDEVGRGPWAGPLVVGAVILGDAEIVGLTDSKKLTKKKREALAPEIYEKAVAVGLGWVSAGELDECGLSAALTLACKRALEEIRAPYHQIVLDGTVNFLKDTGKGPYVTTLKQADLLVPSVSAASIVAKVARDEFMAEMAELYPQYGFEGHVGYGTAAHRKAIELHGITPLHRKSFAPIHSIIVSQSSRPTISRHVKTKLSSRAPAELPAEERVKQSSERREHNFVFPGLNRGVEDRATTTQSVPHADRTTRKIGNESENAAAEYLIAKGYTVLERNWKTKLCEIDIVAQKGKTVYFCEVKHRRSDRQGSGLDAITPKKYHQMLFAARVFAHYQQIGDMDLRLVAIATTGVPPSVTDCIEL